MTAAEAVWWAGGFLYLAAMALCIRWLLWIRWARKTFREIDEGWQKLNAQWGKVQESADKLQKEIDEYSKRYGR